MADSKQKKSRTWIAMGWRYFWPLIKVFQTALLLVTGITGYISARPLLNGIDLLGLMGSLFLAISGSTILNMVFDRDIDALMARTAHRPLPSGKISLKEALSFGIGFSIAGLLWAFSLSMLFGTVIFCGLFIDVLVYTLWLKRRTPWSIVWGGISGGMPILAGRVLGIGRIDTIGILLSASILLWIPTHIMTFNIRYFEDYHRAGIPTFPSTYGYHHTRWIIALSSLGSAIAMGLGFIALELAGGYLRILAVMSLGIVILAVISVFKPSEKINFGLFKYASIFMLGSMTLMVIGVLR